MRNLPSSDWDSGILSGANQVVGSARGFVHADEGKTAVVAGGELFHERGDLLIVAAGGEHFVLAEAGEELLEEFNVGGDHQLAEGDADGGIWQDAFFRGIFFRGWLGVGFDGSEAGGFDFDFVELFGRDALPEDVCTEVAAFDVRLMLHDFGERFCELGFVVGFDSQYRALVVDRDGEREIGEESDSLAHVADEFLADVDLRAVGVLLDAFHRSFEGVFVALEGVEE